jgi:serine/threonine protein kinase
MNSDHRERIRDLLAQASELQEEQRRPFLDAAGAADPGLKAELDRVLAAGADNGPPVPDPSLPAYVDPFEATLVGPATECRVGPYRILERLGQGGMGVVYLAEDTRLGRQVAIKALAPHLAGDERHRARLRREARAAAALGHPGIATVFALEDFQGTLLIVSEYVPGETLKAEIARGPLPLPRFLQTAVELAEILADTHEQGIIHRDLKPHNVIRMPSGRLKILDFGLARLEDPRQDRLTATHTHLTEAGAFLGTPAYSSPEQLRGSGVDFRTDIFSLGVMLFELATGIHPFGDRNSLSTVTRILEAEPPDLQQVAPRLPPGLDRILKRCLQKTPAARYSSMQELVMDLKRLALELSGSGTDRPISRSARATPVWWWQFHQAVVGFAAYGMLYPFWVVREWIPPLPGMAVFLVAVSAVVVFANIRFHLWFTSRFYPEQLPLQRRRVRRLQSTAETIFIALLAATALAILESHAFWSALLLGSAIALAVGRWVIEPVSNRAAFGG